MKNQAVIASILTLLFTLPSGFAREPEDLFGSREERRESVNSLAAVKRKEDKKLRADIAMMEKLYARLLLSLRLGDEKAYNDLIEGADDVVADELSFMLRAAEKLEFSRRGKKAGVISLSAGFALFAITKKIKKFNGSFSRTMSVGSSLFGAGALFGAKKVGDTISEKRGVAVKELRENVNISGALDEVVRGFSPLYKNNEKLRLQLKADVEKEFFASVAEGRDTNLNSVLLKYFDKESIEAYLAIQKDVASFQNDFAEIQLEKNVSLKAYHEAMTLVLSKLKGYIVGKEEIKNQNNKSFFFSEDADLLDEVESVLD